MPTRSMRDFCNACGISARARKPSARPARSLLAATCISTPRPARNSCCHGRQNPVRRWNAPTGQGSRHANSGRAGTEAKRLPSAIAATLRYRAWRRSDDRSHALFCLHDLRWRKSMAMMERPKRQLARTLATRAHGLLAVIAGLDPVGAGRHSSAGQSMAEASAVAGMDPRIKAEDDNREWICRGANRLPLWMTVGVSWRGARRLLAVIARLAPVGVGRHSSA